MQKGTLAGLMNSAVRKELEVAVMALALCGCVSVPDRPSRSTLGCAQAIVSTRVPSGLADKPTHCIAAAMIARYCSRTEAALASIGKEVKDLFSAGDAEWADLRADREGLRCAMGPGDDSAVGECCRLATGVPPRSGD
jgi:hypothetical protein